MFKKTYLCRVKKSSMEKYRTRMITNMEKKFCTEKNKEYMIALKLKSITI